MPTTLTFSPDRAPASTLRATDPVLARVIDGVGAFEITLRDDRFTALARAIVGQQLSVSAAATIWGRLVTLAHTPDATTLAGLDPDALRSVGLSRGKAAYVHDLAVRVLDGSVELDRFDELSDDEIIAELTAVKGIGRWTAEMFLMFSLGRPDVFAVDDVGLQRAVRLAYGRTEPFSAVELGEIAEGWKPYRSAASFYLWEALGRKVLGGV